MLSQLKYRGIIECSNSLEEAVKFLNTLRTESGEFVAADLIFATYDVQAKLDVAIF